MQRHEGYTRTRIQQLANRFRDRIYPQTRAMDQMLVAGPVDRVSWAEAQQLKEWQPASLGQQFGPLWSTFWFRLKASVPAEWAGQRVDLLWVSHSEATLWVDGRSVQGLNWHQGQRPDAVLADNAKPGQVLEIQVEMACNGKFGFLKSPFQTVSPFVLDRCEIALFDPEAWQLYWDLHVLVELEAEQNREPKDLDKTWAGLLLAELNRFANTIDPDDKATWKEAHAILKSLHKHRNADLVHEVSAIGHAHIDTAWLWPLAETHRKCERTFSTQTTYMQAYPDYKFACSQAYQYQVIKDRNPDLYERIRKFVKKGQWVPVGGTWIEPDCNLPSGEAMARQFLFGQRFFQKEFGLRCKEFWNPDVFGYNGQLPQICRLSGITRFLTQKLSWNAFNKPQHHTFIWEGIDGSEVFTHFPPADTYNAEVTIQELRRQARAYKDHDRSRHSITLFGYGDGGGGPTKDMIERIARLADLQGMPRTRFRSSDEFFDLLERDNTDRVRIVGELYFELHRGTYTTQAQTKRGNRKSEFLLHDVEFLSAVAASRTGHQGFAYPQARIDALWRVVLLNQFHDILPGSSITLVYEDTARDYARIESEARELRGQALGAVVGKGSDVVVVNTTGFDRCEVVRTPDGSLKFASVPSYGTGKPAGTGDKPAGTGETVSVTEAGDRIILENARLRATLTKGGRLASLVEKSAGREALDGEGNRFILYEDHPTNWDAWDVEPQMLETGRDLPPAEACTVSSRDPLRAEVTFQYAFGRSRMVQVVRLDAGARRLEFHCDVHWHESEKWLKVAFPVNVRAMNATYEMQFGSVERPTHYNHSLDLAKFEVPAHKWADLSEHGFGVALLSESKYGFSTHGHTLHMSLLRAPKYPDPKADIGRQQFAFALMPHAGGWREGGVVAEGYKFNVPLLVATGAAGAAAPHSFASCDDRNLVLDTVKKAEDSDAVVVRLYECHGARGTARVRVDVPFKTATFCNILEEDSGPAIVKDGAIEVPYLPYKIITLKLA